MRDLLAGLEGVVRGEVRRDALLAPFTTYRIGGPALAVVVPADRDDLRALLFHLREREVPWVVLGGGSNVLVADAGFRGVVVRPGPGLRGVRLLSPAAGGTPSRVLLRAGAGMHLSTLVARGVRDGLWDLVGLAGIPGTVGGAVAGNAGTPEGEVADVAVAVEVVTPEGVREFPASELRFGYRRASLPEGAVVTALTLASRVGDPREVADRVDALLRRRATTQPQGRTAGCVFRNPPGDHAGRLLEAAGLKGQVRGGAKISELHANFIVTGPGATAADVLGLMDLARERVLAQFGVALEPETVFVGQWSLEVR